MRRVLAIVASVLLPALANAATVFPERGIPVFLFVLPPDVVEAKTVGTFEITDSSAGEVTSARSSFAGLESSLITKIGARAGELNFASQPLFIHFKSKFPPLALVRKPAVNAGRSSPSTVYTVGVSSSITAMLSALVLLITVKNSDVVRRRLVYKRRTLRQQHARVC